MLWMSMVPATLRANPQGEAVVGGAAGFNRPDAATLIVKQQTDRAVINWNSFSIANGELTKFVQPSSSSAVLNRVVTANPSAIYGTLQANGNVYLINPGGVLVGAGGVVNTASFVASTHDINTEEFMKGGQLNFKGNSDASVVNEGNITAREGDVFLIAKEVRNEGQLMAKDGTVGMVSGTEVSLQAVGQGNFKVRLMAAEKPMEEDGGQKTKGSAEIVNEGVIQAANAVLEAKGSYLPMAIKNTGVIEATGLVENGDGSVTLTGGEGDILNTGVVAALQRSLDGQKETGGSIMMTAKNVTSNPGSIITAAGKDGGGTVKLRAADTTILRGEISVVGASESAKGGKVQLLGERVGLLESAKVDASGGAGGGQVLVGGDYLGKNPEVPNAKAVVLAPNAKILADATVNGDGGRVILWSDEYTGFYGYISGQAGTQGGDGGFVETSSKINLQAFGAGNTYAPLGNPGQWLLDPANVTITAATTANMSNLGPAAATGNIWYTTANTAQLSAATVSGLLGTASVAVTTEPVGTQPGNITVNTGVGILWTSGNTLRLRANAGIVINGTISGSDNGVLELYSSSAGAATQGTAGVISVGSLLLNGLGNGTLLNGANVVDSIAARGLSGVVSFRDTGGFNGATGLVISTVTAGSVTGYTSATDTGTTIPATTAIGIISAGTVNLTSTGPITQTARINMSGGNFCAVTVNATGQDIILTNAENAVGTISLQTLNAAGTAARSANIRFAEESGFAIGQTAGMGVVVAGAPLGLLLDGAIRTLRPGEDPLFPFTGGSIVLQGGLSADSIRANVTQDTTIDGAIIGSNLGLLGDANFILDTATGAGGGAAPDASANNITTLAANLLLAADLAYLDEDGFQVFFVNFNPSGTTNDVFIPGIRLVGEGVTGTTQYLTGDLVLTSLAGLEFSGIQLTSTGTVFVPGSTLGVTARTITSDNQYNLLSTFTQNLAPGHIEVSGNVTITVEDGDGSGITTTEANRFTLQEGIHLFAGMGADLTDFGNKGSANIQADNMIIGSDTRPDLAMHGLIMTGNVNEAGTVPFLTGTFFRPFTDQRQAYIVTTKADYDVTPNPGELQLTQGELRRVNSNRLQVRSSFSDSTQPAVDVRTPLNLYGLYDTVEVSGLFPTNPGVNRLELIASGASDATTSTFSNVQVSADISSDANQFPMDIFLSASQLDDADPTQNQLSGGKIFVNGGLRSYGGQIGLQGQNVSINAAVNANNPNFTDGLGLVAIFPGRGPNVDNGGLGTATPILLGSKDTTPIIGDDVLGILRTELALITAGTVQIGDVELRPAVLSPVNPFTGSSIVGTNPLWKNGIQVVDAGSITVTDLISNLSFDTLALVTSGGLAQTAQAGLQVPGLFVVGNPADFTTTDYVLDGAFNKVDRLAVALGLATATGAPSGDLLLVNQKGLVGGNGGEVARIQQQWDQGYTRTTTAPFLSTGVGLVVARALSITASGSVSIYETVPTGVTGLGYIGHVASNPNALSNGSNGYAQVGNEIGLVGDSTSGLAINVIQNAAGTSGANSVWAAAARGLSINDLTGEFGATAAEAGILTNGGQVTLEGNAIEIANTVARVATSAGDFSANTITIDTTGALTTAGGSAVAPSGARVVIRPATGQNGFQNRAGSGAFDPNLENSPLNGAPVEMNLGTTSIGAGTTFLNASLGTVFIGNAALAGTAIRGSVMEIGRNTDPATAAGKFSITANIGALGNRLSSLLGDIHLISGGAIEDQNLVSGAAPFTITSFLNQVVGNGGLAAEALGAVALQGDVSVFATDAGANNNVRFIDNLGGVSIGVVDGVSGVLANTFYLNVTGGIAQSSGATIQAAGGGISVSATGAIRLDQENDFNLVAASSPSTVYLRSAGPMSIGIFGAGQPGGQPAGVAGITGSNVTLVAGGDLQQSDLAQITASGSFLATVLDGSDVLLNSTLNILGARPVVAALKVDGSLGNIANLTLVNNGAIILGSAGLLAAELSAAGSGWTQAPTATVSGSLGASVSTVMGLNTIAVSSGGSGYQSAPLVTLTEAGVGTGVGASAVAIVDSNPLSSTYGQVTSINITNAGTGYTGTVTASLSGGGAAQDATVGTITLAIQRLNVKNPGIGYTSTPTITFTGGGGGSGATATAVIGGTGGYVASGSTTVLGGITGNLDITAASGGITSGSGLSVAGTTTLTGSSGVGIILGSQNNNLQGVLTITENGAGPVTVVNKNGLILGDITVGTGILIMTTSSSSGITQSSAGNRVVAGGVATFIANNGGPIGPVILNNAQNSFAGMVNAYGTRVVIRNSASTGLELGNVTASSSLTAASTSAGITQSGVGINSTGAASFAAANGFSIDVGTQANTFSSTVSFAALSGTLANVNVRDTTALDLGAMTLTGSLGATAPGITQSGALVVPGTITLAGGTANNITLSNAVNNFGTVLITSGNNVTITDLNSVILGAGAVSGALNLNSGISSQSGPITVAGTTTVTAGLNAIDLSNSGNDFGTSVNLSNTGANNISVRDTGALVIGNISMSSGLVGGLTVQAGGDITQLTGTTITTGTGVIAITGVNGSSVALANSGNAFNGTVTLAPSVGAGNRLLNVSLSDTTAFQVQSGLTLGGNLTLTAADITQAGPITVVGTTTLNGGTGAIVLTNSGNSYGGTVTVTGGASADMFFSLADEGDLGPVTTSGTFTLRTAPTISFNIANGASAGFDVTSAKLSNFNVGTFAPIATGGGDLDLGNLTSYPGIGGISLTTVGGGDINALGAINLNTLQFNSSGAATFSAVNGIQNLGSITVAVGGITLQNARGLNLTGAATMLGRLSLEVAGQFYNQTGQSQPLGGVAGGSVIKSLSLMGGLPNQVSGLSGFTVRYDGVMPNSGNVTSYAVSPLAMFAPSGTTIAGVELSGTQTGGGQFNTFLTGSDNLNWMISDFGRFDMPTVKPSGMDYILYPQRVEPETKTLPAAMLGQLERELGRPPTLDEVQAREVAVREAAMVRSGAILERTSFDAVEDEGDKQESAEVPVQVIDGGKPQAGGPSFAPSPASAGGASEGFGPQASKSQSVKQGANGPILRSGPMRSVAELRPAEPTERANAGKTATQAVRLDAKSVIEQERASAEVGIAPPIAAGR